MMESKDQVKNYTTMRDMRIPPKAIEIQAGEEGRGQVRQRTRKERERENGIYWKDQKDDVDGGTIPTP